MTFLAFDIEATVDPAMPVYESKDDRPFPPAPWWIVEVIGTLSANADMHARRFSIVTGAREIDRVASFVATLEKHRPQLLSFNGAGFDVPVIVAACMRHGIPFPRRFARDFAYRYSTDGHHDLLDTLADFGSARRATLDAWARVVGFPGKLDTTGDDVAGLLAAGERERVECYCLCDVAQTFAIALRDRLVRGMAATAYQSAAFALLSVIDADARLCDLAPHIDRERFLSAVGGATIAQCEWCETWRFASLDCPKCL